MLVQGEYWTQIHENAGNDSLHFVLCTLPRTNVASRIQNLFFFPKDFQGVSMSSLPLKWLPACKWPQHFLALRVSLQPQGDTRITGRAASRLQLLRATSVGCSLGRQQWRNPTLERQWGLGDSEPPSRNFPFHSLVYP